MTHPAPPRRLPRALVAAVGSAPVSRVFARVLHRLDLAVHRRSGGRTTLLAMMSGLPVVLLTTTGARSGLARTWPLVGLPDGHRTVVIASNYGQAHHPAWYHNLRAHPQATITADGSPVAVRADEATGAERDRLWADALRVYPAWAAYARRAAPRRIPVVVLTPGQPEQP